MSRELTQALSASLKGTQVEMDALRRENADLKRYLLDITLDMERVIVQQDVEFDVDEMRVWCSQMKTLLGA